MEIYKNLSGQSGVKSYTYGDDFILTLFTVPGKDGAKTYIYTYKSAGQQNVDHMKQLAAQGSGLNSFINTNVRKLYAYKF